MDLPEWMLFDVFYACGALLVLIGVAGCVSSSDDITGTPNDLYAAIDTIVAHIGQPTLPEARYDPRDFGAVGDGRTDDRKAIQLAVDTANAKGGGVVVLSEGEWFSHGPIHLKSHTWLKVSEGATLTFTEDTSAYLPQVFTRWEGTEAYNYSPLIYAWQAVNTGLIGKGVINGNATTGFGTWRDHQRKAQDRLREMGENGDPVHTRVFGPGKDAQGDFLRPSMIQFLGCQNVIVRDVTIHDSPFWVIHLVYCRDAIVQGVTVDSHRLNNDGVDIDSSVNVLIEDNTFITGDDSIVIKSGRDQDAWRVGRPSENIVIRRNTMEGHNALAVGSEMSGGVRNVFMVENTLRDVRSALYFKSNLDRGGMIENIRIRDIRVGTANTLIRFTTNYHSHRGGTKPSLYRDFLIENVHARKVDTLIEAIGVAELPIQDVRLRNIVADSAEKTLDIRHVKNFTLKDVYANGETVHVHESGPEE